MIEEAYVSFETAKLLEEKGFNIPIWTYYEDDNEVIFGDKYDWNNSPMGHTSAPTLQMAMKWLREEHNIHIDICSICDIAHWLYQVFVITPRTARNSYVDKILYTSHEQAVEAGIKYALENLV